MGISRELREALLRVWMRLRQHVRGAIAARPEQPVAMIVKSPVIARTIAVTLMITIVPAIIGEKFQIVSLPVEAAISPRREAWFGWWMPTQGPGRWR